MPLKTRLSSAHLLQAVAFLLLVSASIVALWPLQRDISQRLDQMKHQVVVRLEQATGRRITYQSISPSIFRFIEIRGLDIFDPGEKTPLLQIRRIEVSYSIWKLLTENPADAINAISIENSSLRIDTRHDADLIRFFDDLVKGNGGVQTAGSVRIEGKNLTLSVTGPNATFSVDRLFFQVQNAGAAVHVQVRGGVHLALKKAPLGLRSVETAIRVSGSVDRQLAWSDLRVRFDNLTSNLLNLSRPTFHVTLRDGLWQLRKIQDSAPIDIQASYDLRTQLATVSFVADGFRPEDYFTFGEQLESYSPWLTSKLSGSGTVSYSLAKKALDYRANVRVGLSNRLLPFPMNAAAELSGNLRTATFSQLNVRSEYGDIGFAGSVDLANLLPRGTLKATNIYTPIGSRLSADFRIERHGSRVDARSQSVVVGDTVLYGVGISLAPSPSSIDFAVTASFDTHGKQIQGSGVAYLSRDPYIALSISTNAMPLDQFYELVEPRPLPTVLDTLKGLQMSSRLFVTSNLKQFSFASPMVTISDAGPSPERRVSLRFSGTNRSLNVQNLAVDWRGYQVAGSFDAAFVQKDRVAFSSTATVEKTSYSVHGFYQQGDSLILSGTHGIDLAAVKQGDSYVFSLKTENLPIPFSKVTTGATLDLQGIYRGPRHWEVVSRNSSFKDLPVPGAGTNSLELSGRLSATGGDVYSLTYADSISRLTGNGKVSLDPTGRGLSGNGWLQLTGSLPGESYATNFSFTPGQIDASLRFSNSPLARLGRLPVSGQASGEIAVKGKLTNPDLSVRLSLPDGQIYSDPLTADVAFTVSTSTIRLQSLSARYLTSSLSGAQGQFDFLSGKFNVTANYRGDVNGDLVSAHVALGGEATPIRRRSELSQILSSNLTALAQVSSITVENTPVKPWDVTLERSAKRLVFSGGPDAGVSGYILESGKFAVNLVAPLPVTLQAAGQITGSTVNASLENVVLDLHAFDSVAKIPYFDISRGKARGNLDIAGSVNDPDFQGELVATEVYGRTPVIPNEIGPFNTNLVFAGKSLSMSDVAIRSGNSQVLGNLSFTLDHWIPTSYDLKFVTQSNQGVHVKYTISGIDFDGYATGTTTIKGDSLGTQIGGNLDINSCLITLKSGEPNTAASVGSTTTSTVDYDFTFTTGRQVQFVWPNNTIPILRSFADTGQTLKITANGSTGAFTIVGNINVKGGEVFYLRQNFYIRQGSITFNEDQNKFDPIVNVRAELREIDTEGKNVSIYLVVNNKPLSQFTPSFESDPPMSNAEILAMLGQDIYAQLGGRQLDLTSAMLFTGDLLSQFSIVRTFEDKVKQAFNLDLFSVRTDLLQNVFREKVLGQAPSPSTTTGSSLGRYLDNTTFFLGKYFGNDLFLEAMINLRSNNALLTNYGNTGNLQVDSEILFEWRTPLFLLQLSFLPDPTDFLASLANTSLSLSWGFSF